jgi:extracellular elastinolytic metalloproteinase
MKVRFLTTLVAAALLAAPAALAVVPDSGDGHRQRNFDARVRHNAAFEAAPGAAQRQRVEALAAAVPELAATFDPATGVTRTLYNRVGYLTGPDPRPALDVALAYVHAHAQLLGLTDADLARWEVTDSVLNRVTGATHLYLRQTSQGIPVYNGQLHVNVNRDGRVISVNNAFVPGLAGVDVSLGPALAAAAAVRAAALHLGLGGRFEPRVISGPRGPRRTTRLEAKGLSAAEIVAELVWLPVRRGDVRLAWSFQVETTDGEHLYDLTVDAADGRVWTRFDWTSSDSYRVYPQPVESPNHTTPLPPSDGRVLVSDPADSTASPLGWHDTGSTGYTIMRGNNVHAYDDADANNAPPSSQPSCGAAHVCDFTLNLTQAPSAYRPAAIANLFYWNNVIHDVQYQYGFDEAGGNFQVNNFGNGGAGNDDVRAEAQDGGGTNNANFSTPTDGGRPRMQMYIWTAPNPDRDGDVDNGIVIHEYGHGISTRQVGGPNNSSCLNNNQQPGEGWSDWHALVYTAETGDQGTDPRGIGTYALNQPTSGAGIRTQRYSTNPAVNNHTYQSIQGKAIPHGVGEVWAQAIWEVYWALVDAHGFDPDLYDAAGGAGNQRALLYVNEGFKNTACSPTFVNARDGIIQAATDNYGGADVCLIWEAFAAFGLGTDAVSGGSSSTNPTNFMY